MEHVAANGAAFKDSFFKVKGISVFQLAEDVVQASSASSSPSSTSRYVAQEVNLVGFTTQHILT